MVRSFEQATVSLSVAVRLRDDIAILDLNGDLTFGEADLELRERMLAVFQAGTVRIVLNLSEVDRIDSTGLGTVVFALAKLRKAGGGLALLHVRQDHMQLFTLARLALTFEFFEDEQDAVNSFFPERAVKRFDILSFVRQEEAQKQ